VLVEDVEKIEKLMMLMKVSCATPGTPTFVKRLEMLSPVNRDRLKTFLRLIHPAINE
jgi:hypothetical protein